MTVATKTSDWFGHPRGLTVLFFTEMWEIFSYYGMRALLVFYMVKQLGFDQPYASFIYGAYGAFSYLTPIFGGPLADKYLGRRRAVIIGGSIMAIGHFLMAFDALFYIALITIAVGNGLFLPSLPAQIGELYAQDDPRRKWAYNVYYVGINIGGFLAPLICGTLGELYGWHYGFTAAGIGMLIGLLIYIKGGRYLPTLSTTPRSQVQDTGNSASLISQILALAGIALAVIVFRGAYEQVGNTVALWIDSGVDRSVGAYAIPMTWFQSLNPLMVILMTPLLLGFWRRRAANGWKQSTLRTMALGATIVAIAYVMIAAIPFVFGPSKVHWILLVAFFIILTLGEIHILPTGLGLFARMAPRNMGATMVAAWFLLTFFGSLLAGGLGALWSYMEPSQFFLAMALTSSLSAGALGYLSIKRPVE